MTGPKDASVETYGLPLAASRSFRAGFLAFGEASAAMFCRAAIVRETTPIERRPLSVALAYSWV
jgi:hypothetical protein